MKTALIADVHGNAPALEAVLVAADAKGADRILSLGDIAGYYCELNECIALLRERRVLNVMGNHDHYLLTNTACSRSTSANVCLAYQRTSIAPEHFAWLEGSLREYREEGSWFVHGGWNDPLDEYVGNFDFRRPPEERVRLFASGHTHVQTLQRGERRTYVNPGSVGQPRDGDSRAAFAMIDDEGGVTLCRVDYDIDRIAHAMKRAGFDRRFYAGLYHGRGIQTFCQEGVG